MLRGDLKLEKGEPECRLLGLAGLRSSFGVLGDRSDSSVCSTSRFPLLAAMPLPLFPADLWEPPDCNCETAAALSIESIFLVEMVSPLSPMLSSGAGVGLLLAPPGVGTLLEKRGTESIDSTCVGGPPSVMEDLLIPPRESLLT
mmetsp:Transcript_7230/g.15791  ORF Transcript_7230/g.15791 Transcript_7230/m.15791 type:complete len:144 (-) Transcript_7230:46-477(-)